MRSISWHPDRSESKLSHEIEASGQPVQDGARRPNSEKNIDCFAVSVESYHTDLSTFPRILFSSFCFSYLKQMSLLTCISDIKNY